MNDHNGSKPPNDHDGSVRADRPMQRNRSDQNARRQDGHQDERRRDRRNHRNNFHSKKRDGGGQRSGRRRKNRNSGPPRYEAQKNRTSYVPKKTTGGRPDIFELFCAYHLGITHDGGYRQQNIHDLARRFACTPAEIKQSLVDYRMDPQTMINSDFDLSLAQLDIQVAPEGVDRYELARPWFEEFLEANPNARDWQQELEDDAKENEKIFGKT